MISEWDAWFDRFIDPDGPGAAVAVELRGERVYEAQRGLANLEWRAPVDGETIFRIASLGKQFTGAAIVRLSEAGKLALDDPIALHLPAFDGSSVSVRQLLNHMSGLGDYTEDDHFMTYEVRRDHTTAELVAIIRALPTLFEPGARCIYNNSNYVLLGAIVEAVSGQALDAYLRSEILEPAGLVRTRYLHDSQVIPKRADGYTAGPARAPPLAMTNPHGAGGLGSTPGELLTWSRALREGRVVSPVGYRAMVTPGRPRDGRDLTRGFGLFSDTLRGEAVISHSGAIFGFRAHLAHWPAHDLTVAALANANPFPIEQLAHGLARRALGKADAAYDAIVLSPSELAAFTGRFEFHTTEVLDLAVADGGLASSFPESGSVYRALGGGHFFLEADPEITFRFTDPGHGAVVFEGYRSPRVGVRIG